MLDIPYAAGFLDGEGTFTVVPRKGMHSFMTIVCAAGTDRRPLVALQELLGGSISPVKKRGRHRQQYRWQLASAQARTAARLLMPYLLVKRRNAEILSNWPIQHQGNHTDEETYQQQLDLAAELRALNKRGD